MDKIDKLTIVLIDSFTGSNRAISAYAFKNASSKVLIIGEPSREMLSVNESYPLPDGNFFNLMMLRIFSKENVMAPLKLDVDDYAEHDYQSMFTDHDPQLQRVISRLDHL